MREFLFKGKRKAVSEMEKYINANRLLQRLTTVNSTVEQGIKYYNFVYNLVNEEPAADVVEVIRCKDCKLSSESKTASRYDLYCYGYDVYYCEKEQKIVSGSHYCSYGEKRIENE